MRSRSAYLELYMIGNRMHLSRDAILEAKDREVVEVDCPEWGGSVLVRGMSGKERDMFEMSLQDAGDAVQVQRGRSEEHTSELQSRQYLVFRLLLEKKKNIA